MVKRINVSIEEGHFAFVKNRNLKPSSILRAAICEIMTHERQPGDLRVANERLQLAISKLQKATDIISGFVPQDKQNELNSLLAKI